MTQPTATTINAVNICLLGLLLLTELAVLVWTRRRKEITYLTSRSNQITMSYVLVSTVLSILLVINISAIPIGDLKGPNANLVNLLNQLFGDILLAGLLLALACYHVHQIIQLCKTKVGSPSETTCDRFQQVIIYGGMIVLGFFATPKIVLNVLTRNIKGDHTPLWTANRTFNYLWDAMYLVNTIVLVSLSVIFSGIYYRKRAIKSHYYTRRLVLLNTMLWSFVLCMGARIAVRSVQYGIFLQELLPAAGAIWPFSVVKLFELFHLLLVTIVVGPLCNRTVDLGMGEKQALFGEPTRIYTNA